MTVTSPPRNQQAAAFPARADTHQRLPAANPPAMGLMGQAGWCVTGSAKGCQPGFSMERMRLVL